jgi:hypothetical protein
MRLSSITLVLLGTLASCFPSDVNSFAERYTTPEERAFSENYLHLLSSARLDSATALLAPHLRGDSVAHGLRVVSTLLRDAHLDSLHFIGINVSNHAGTQSRDVNLIYEAPTTHGRWLTAHVATRSARGHTSVIGFSANVVARRLEDLHAFTLADRSFIHYVWLVLATLMPVVTIAMAIRVIRAKGMRRRWLWAVAALIASPAFTLNWTTGQAILANNTFILFGGAFFRPGAAAPWSLTFAMPIGAFVAYLRFRAWQNPRE